MISPLDHWFGNPPKQPCWGMSFACGCKFWVSWLGRRVCSPRKHPPPKKPCPACTFNVPSLPQELQRGPFLEELSQLVPNFAGVALRAQATDRRPGGCGRRGRAFHRETRRGPRREETGMVLGKDKEPPPAAPKWAADRMPGYNTAKRRRISPPLPATLA